MTLPLPINYLQIMRLGIEIIGNFMYPRSALAEVLALACAGLLHLSAIRPTASTLGSPPEAIVAAGTVGSTEPVIVKAGPG